MTHMTKEELLDTFAIEAMKALVATGKYNMESAVRFAYQVAENMVDEKYRILEKWKINEDIKTDSIEKLSLGLRYEHCLRSENIYTITQLKQWSVRELRKVPNLGMKGIKQIEYAMSVIGLHLKGQEPCVNT
jgi:DNA-directed RNA polymerase alpha subunit